MQINITQTLLFAAVSIMLVVIIRSVAMEKLPRRLFLVLWEIILFRLLVPVTIQTDRLPSLWKLIDNIRNADTKGVAAGNSTRIFTEYGSLTGGSGWADRLPIILTALWIGGAVIGIIFFLRSYILCMREFRTSLPLKHPLTEQWLKAHPLRRKLQIRYSDQIRSPLTYGILRPVILLPADTSLSDTTALTYVLTHEYVHIRHADNLLKLLLSLTLCLYWYHPLVWVLYILANRDIELSCDEQVLSLLGSDKRASYALLLLDMEEYRQIHRPPLFSNFSKNATQERITLLMNKKKISIIGTIAALVVLVFTMTAFAADEVPETDAETEITLDESADSEDPEENVMELPEIEFADGDELPETDENDETDSMDVNADEDGIEIEEASEEEQNPSDPHFTSENEEAPEEPDLSLD